SCSSTTLHHPIQQEEVRTPHDIYREIVVECEQIERSGTSSPLSDFEASPTSPNRHLTSTPPQIPTASTSPLPFPMSPFMPEQTDYSHMLANGHFAGTAGLAPPPYSLMPTPVEDFPESLLHQPLEQAMLIPQQIKQDDSLVLEKIYQETKWRGSKLAEPPGIISCGIFFMNHMQYC
ncbi:hypothetical protein OESDEN_07423, partial [Oesophagostomum dentatum]